MTLQYKAFFLLCSACVLPCTSYLLQIQFPYWVSASQAHWLLSYQPSHINRKRLVSVGHILMIHTPKRMSQLGGCMGEVSTSLVQLPPENWKSSHSHTQRLGVINFGRYLLLHRFLHSFETYIKACGKFQNGVLWLFFLKATAVSGVKLPEKKTCYPMGEGLERSRILTRLGAHNSAILSPKETSQTLKSYHKAVHCAKCQVHI